ncbi:hypothetical protein GW17_00059701 [Ensete ventricosum]|nr:hypothetical protein GW17_00059701 [Ensete ventricosum]
MSPTCRRCKVVVSLVASGGCICSASTMGCDSLATTAVATVEPLRDDYNNVVIAAISLRHLLATTSINWMSKVTMPSNYTMDS